MCSKAQRRGVQQIIYPFVVLHQQQICVVQMKGFINCQKIDELNHYGPHIPNLQSLLELSEQKYQTKLSQQTATSISKLAHQINEREKKKVSGKGKGSATTFWVFGERKVFCWALIFYTHMNQLDLQQLNDSHLTEIQTIFPQRSLDFLRYEIAAINSSKIKHRQCWTEPETRLLSEIVEKTSSKSGRGEEKYDWKQISFSLFCESKGAYFKPLQDCRQKWCNYLNPNLNKEQWSLDEDVKLFELIEKEGCKWALISRKFELIRTEHMVKNRFNAYINNWKTKRSNVKSKRGLINRIYRYLKTRLNKKQERLENMEEQLSSAFVEETDKINEYSYQMAEQSEEPFYDFANNNALTARHCYDLEKKEKKTAENDEPEMIDYSVSRCSMVEEPNDNLLPYGLEEMENEQLGLQPFNYELLLNPMEDVKLRCEGKDEMKLIQAEVVQALGCSHFQRALKFECNQFQDVESFSWLV